MNTQPFNSTRPRIQAQIDFERKLAKTWRIVILINRTIAAYAIALVAYFVAVGVTV